MAKNKDIILEHYKFINRIMLKTLKIFSIQNLPIKDLHAKLELSDKGRVDVCRTFTKMP